MLGQNHRWLLLLGVLPALLALYAGFWAFWYRLPAQPPKVIDRRSAKTDPAYCLTFCASLADNPHGFPGHCYVAWSQAPPRDLSSMESAGFVPRCRGDQIASLVAPVPGLLVNNASTGNTRNLDLIYVLVSFDTYRQTMQMRDTFKSGYFQVGVRDCVTFTNSIASMVGLNTPNTSYQFPQDYLRQLKALN